MNGGFVFSCPRCEGSLSPDGEEVLTCNADGLRFERLDGVWHFLLPERQVYYEKFIQEYEFIRRSEGRGLAGADYFRALPYQDLSGRMAGDWQIRAASFTALLKRVLEPLEKAANQPLRILDLGAGNGWLSNRLAQRGHYLAAVDLAINDFDGLGCWQFYELSFVPIQAEFNHLPFYPHSVDLVIFNASLHYSENYVATLSEALRVLAPKGCLVILDSPIYHQAASGEQMVREREAGFTKQYGCPSNALKSGNYLTYEGVKNLGGLLHMSWEKIVPDYNLRWRLRPFLAWLLGRREPAKFEILVGRVNGNG